MIIRKEYKFYYAHRNQDLINSSCFRIHGHDCHLFLHFDVIRNGNITTLFSDFDDKIEPFLKNEFDHRMLIDTNDVLLKSLQTHENETGEMLGYKRLPFPTSVENVCFYLFYRIVNDFKFALHRIEFQETRSSIISYSYEDFLGDYKGNIGKVLKEFIKSEEK